ncbi:hypothetical protein ACS8E2_12730 [Psychrobacter glaciei]|uniref:hypothetical protein n=1 Tax=Psychrobacter glaciei TaxID=619771 RepID=UPI003F487094
MGDDMSEYVDIVQSDDRDSLTISLNDSGEIIIEHDCDEFHAPYALIGIDKWQDVKAAVDALIEANHENQN